MKRNTIVTEPADFKLGVDFELNGRVRLKGFETSLNLALSSMRFSDRILFKNRAFKELSAPAIEVLISDIIRARSVIKQHLNNINHLIISGLLKQ